MSVDYNSRCSISALLITMVVQRDSTRTHCTLNHVILHTTKTHILPCAITAHRKSMYVTFPYVSTAVGAQWRQFARWYRVINSHRNVKRHTRIHGFKSFNSKLLSFQRNYSIISGPQWTSSSGI